MAKRTAGRPTKLTPEVEKTIVDSVIAGNYVHVAAALAGVSKDTVLEWMVSGGQEIDRRNRGKPADPKLDNLVEFSGAVRRALAQGEVRNVAHIAGADDWRARMELLSRMYPSRWGRRDRIGVEAHLSGATGAGDGETEQEQVERILSDPRSRDAFDALAARLAREPGGDG